MRLLAYFYLSSVPFTRAVLSGESSLGGSESACLGLMEALARRGHDVHAFAAQLADDAVQEWRGVSWHPAETMTDTLAFAPPDVFVSLRMVDVFSHRIDARMVILWAEDLLTDPASVGQLAQVDHVAYVSAFHRKQWEGLQPILAPLGWVTRNGMGVTDVPPEGSVERIPHRFIYTSRPERGLKPLLQMWPAIRARIPDAELQICRYRSMYDGEGTAVAQSCQNYDELTAHVQSQVGGITVLGHLNKPSLYRALSSASALLYPGVAGFAETNGIAWTEAQACGTPIVSSWKGAAPETIHRDAGVLIDGDAETPEYQSAFVDAVCRISEDAVLGERMGAAGRAWAKRSSHDEIAAEWEAQIGAWFQSRYDSNTVGVLRQLLWCDNHAQAAQLAERILDGAPSPEDAAEATAARDLCALVLSQKHQTQDDYATYAVQDPEKEAAGNGRLMRAADVVSAGSPSRVLDVACGNGSMALLLAQRLPNASVDGWDSSAGVLALAGAAAQSTGVAGRVTFHRGEWSDVHGVYDAVFCGEFLEHVEKPWVVLDRLESHCAPEGTVTLTTPCGPFSELLDVGIPRLRGHVHTFSARDWATMTEHKRDVAMEYIPVGVTPRGTPVGYWLVSFSPGGGPAMPLDYEQDIVTTRPYQRVCASLIVKDEASNLRRCLQSVRRVVDRIVVLDTGSTDGTQDIAKACGADVVEAPWPDDFSAARNQGLDLVQSSCEWVLWLDADEALDAGHQVRKYLSGAGPFVGYSVRQTHLMADQPTFSDKPVRLFKTGRGVRFIGPVHEQPEDAPDAGIFPALELPDCQILHFGYTTDPVRREKLLQRNMRLLHRELHSENPRQLAYVLAIRDYANLALFARESAGGAVTPSARRYLLSAVTLYRRHFTDPAHRLHDLAQPFYEAALEQLGQGWEVEWAFAAAPRKLRGKVRPQRFRVSTAEEMEALVQARVSAWMAQAKGPVIDCEPSVTRNGDGGWSLQSCLATGSLAHGANG